MDAVYSGQAGTLAFLEGSEARVHRGVNFDIEIAIGREGAAYLFQGCNDVVVLRGTRADLARAQYLGAWEADRALRLMLLILDLEVDTDLRLEAADCVETLLQKNEAVLFIENQLYSRAMPKESDVQFLSSASRWPTAAGLIAKITSQQSSIIEVREAWDELPPLLFEDGSKIEFEENAIARGAFRVLASAPPAVGDRNLAVLNCYKALSSLPNARTVVSEWTRTFKGATSRSRILDNEEFEETEWRESPVSGHSAFENAILQQRAIIEKLRVGSTKAARRYTDQLVRSQLMQGGPVYAAKSLCSLAQEAKYFGLYSLQLEWAQRAVDICPSDSWAHGQSADALIQFSRLDEALAELNLAEANGDARFAASGRARILRHQGRLDQALAAFRSNRAKFPGDEAEPFDWSGSAETLRDMWKFEDALEEYERALVRFPQVLFLRCGRAAVLSDLGKLAEALVAYDAPDLRDQLVALNGKSSVLKELGRFQEALDVTARAIELFPTDPVARCGQADILRSKGDLVGALQVYSSTKASNPTVASAYGGYAEVLRDMREFEAAKLAYGEATDLFPFDVRLANGYANIQKVNDELGESLRAYERNVRRFPYDLVSKSGRADLLKRLGQYDDALNAYDEIIKIWPNYLTARNGKAAVLVVRGEFTEAEALLPTKAPETRSEWIAWHIRGMILLRSNELEKAIQHFREGSAKTPFARERRYFDGALSLAKMRQGQFGEAIEALKDAGGGLANVLRLHAYAGMGSVYKAHALYKELSGQCPARLIDLKEAIAIRFNLAKKVVEHNDNWIFERESEAILQEAA
jgi:tetratricopeptide (TPR) repeat protein